MDWMIEPGLDAVLNWKLDLNVMLEPLSEYWNQNGILFLEMDLDQSLDSIWN